MNLNVHPYYDDHIDQYEKKHKQILFNPGRALQARELTQMQSLLNDKMGSNFNTVYHSGGLVEGCDISFSQPTQTVISDTIFTAADNSINSVLTDLTVLFEIGDSIEVFNSADNEGKYIVETVIATKIVVTIASGTITNETPTYDIVLIKDENIAYISEGLVYYEGEVHFVDAQNVSMTKTGTEKFGLKLQEKVVYYTDDPTLTDPASGYDNYNLPGGERLHQEWIFVMDDVDMFEYYTVEDGILIAQTEKPDFNKIIDTLAERTFDESGNYLVKGMNLEVLNSDTADKVIYSITDGKAYVKGYNVNYIAPKTVEVDTSTTIESILNESHNFATGTLNYDINIPYVADVDFVTAIVEVAELEITHNSFGSSDPIGSYENIRWILSVWDVVNGTYTPVTDYLLTGNSVNWSPGGIEPGIGGTYKVQFRYTKTMDGPNESSLDYTVAAGSATDLSAISFTGTGDLPVNTTTFNVGYNYYLARTDLVSIDRTGDIFVSYGIPSYYTQDDIPEASEQYLQLGTVKLYPNKDENSALVYEYKYKRLTMRDLYKMRTRVDDLELNQAELALEAEAQDSELPTELRGILVDNFDNFNKSDTKHTDYKCSQNHIDNELTMLVEYEEVIFDADNVSSSNVTEVDYEDNNNTFLNMLTESVALVIPTKTKVMNLNPFGFIALPGSGKISPVVDFWVDTNIKNISTTEDINVSTVTETKNDLSWWESSRTTTSRVFLDSSVTNAENITKKIITNARQIEIKVSGKKWVPDSTIEILFNNKQVEPTGTDGTLKSGSFLIVKGDGTLSGTINVPAGTRTGNHKISFRDTDKDLYSNVTFTSTGIDKLITRRQTIVNRYQIRRIVHSPVPKPEEPLPPAPVPIIPPVPAPVPDPRPRREQKEDNDRANRGDPLAQSYYFPVDKTFSSIDLYFKTKGSVTSAFLQVGLMVNGYPSLNSVFHYQDIEPGEITVSPDGSIASNIAFTLPFFMPANTPFFITIGSESNEYNVFVSEMGQYDIETGIRVVENPYLTGVLFASSNNSTWSALQTTDLSHTLYEATFERTGEIITENIIPASSIASLMYQIENTTPPGSDIIYSYSTNNGTSWIKIIPETFNWLSELGTQVRMKLELSGDGFVTPIVDLNSMVMMTQRFNNEDDNYYVTKTVDPVPTFNNIKTIFDLYVPSGSSAIPYGSIDGLLYFPLNLNLVSQADVGQDLIEYTFSTNIEDFSEINATLTPGIEPTDGEVFTNGGSFIYRDHDSGTFLIDSSGTVANSTAYTGSSGAIITTTSNANKTAYSTATIFKSKLKLKNFSALNTPVVEKLKYVMKDI